MLYRVVLPKKVQKDLTRIDSHYLGRIKAALVALGKDPFLGKALKGELKGQRSYEVWPYRIIYSIEHHELVVLIIRIGHRQSVYK